MEAKKETQADLAYAQSVIREQLGNVMADAVFGHIAALDAENAAKDERLESAATARGYLAGIVVTRYQHSETLKKALRHAVQMGWIEADMETLNHLGNWCDDDEAALLWRILEGEE